VSTDLKSDSLNLLEPYGPVISLNRDCFTFTAQNYKSVINKILVDEDTTFMQMQGTDSPSTKHHIPENRLANHATVKTL
jgi:hypothetical protein